MKFVLWNGTRNTLTETKVNPFLSNYGCKGLQKNHKLNICLLKNKNKTLKYNLSHQSPVTLCRHKEETSVLEKTVKFTNLICGRSAHIMKSWYPKHFWLAASRERD